MKGISSVLVLATAAGVIAAAAEASAGPVAHKPLAANARIVLLHHSTGECIWNGGVAKWFQTYNAKHKTNYSITEQNFPKESPYGWENYPFDYWNIWVKHAGAKPYKGEPTLEMLTGKYELIVFKHCFPVSNIEADTGRADVTSNEKRIENYKLQYAALKEKMRRFPKTRFLVWTGAAQVRNDTEEAQAHRAKAFFEWVRTKWDEKGDNIYVWDFYELETEGGLYFKAAYASGDAHPNEEFSKKVAPYFCGRVVNVIQGRGDVSSLTGKGGEAEPVPARPEKPAPQPQKPPEKPPRPATAPAPSKPPAEVAATGANAWMFDNAENKAQAARLWGKTAGYVEEGDGHVVKVNFAAGRQEDWDEYGPHRIVCTRPPEKSYDLRPYRYLAFRVKADREMQVVLTLVTLPDPKGPADQSHFGFSAYVRPKAGAWKQVAVDLTKLELSAEGESAYAKAGKPNRPMHLTVLKLAAHEKDQKASFLIDDITFFRDLPESLKEHLQAP